MTDNQTTKTQNTSFTGDIKLALKGLCPKCKTGKIFASPMALNPRDRCPHCDFHLGAHDNGDGPAVFLIFILGFLIVPLALVTDTYFTIALWVHGVLWTAISLLLCVLSLRPLKAYIMLLQYRHLPKTYGEDEDG